jgi:hypothetical protein
MNITLNRLTLGNFKGMSFTLDTGGRRDVDIYGRNASGKTTLADAFSWLLFDKDSLGRSDFEIKTLDENGEAAHGVDHSVEAELSLDGDPITLKKVYREVWTKKRGNPTATFSGNTVNYFVDGVPVQKKEFVARIAEIAGDESTFRLITSPTVFPSLHWTKQREILLSICGDITDADVIKSDSQLSGLPAILDKKTVDEFRKVSAARKATLNEELEQLPVRIDEQKRMMPDVTGLIYKNLLKESQSLEMELNDTKLRLQGIQTGGRMAELTKKSSLLSMQISKIQNSHRATTIKMADNKKREIDDLIAKDLNIGNQEYELTSLIVRLEARLSDENAMLEKYRELWVKVDSQGFTYAEVAVCPTCGQALPEEQLNEAREKALSDFNRRKSENLTEIEQKGKAAKKEADTLQMQILKSQDELKSLGNKTSVETYERLKAEYNELLKAAEDMTLVQGATTLQAELADIEKQIANEQSGRGNDVETIKKEQASLVDALAVVTADMKKFTDRKAGEERIEQLMAEEKLMTAEYEKIESSLYLCDLFIKKKVSLLTDRINAKFEMVNFKLFNELVNGGIEPCCEITVNGVPYGGGLNSGARTQAGCDIIRTLQKHHNLKAPVFIDNRESVTIIPDMPCQVISLIVSPQDKALRVGILFRQVQMLNESKEIPKDVFENIQDSAGKFPDKIYR